MTFLNTSPYNIQTPHLFDFFTFSTWSQRRIKMFQLWSSCLANKDDVSKKKFQNLKQSHRDRFALLTWNRLSTSINFFTFRSSCSLSRARRTAVSRSSTKSWRPATPSWTRWKRPSTSKLAESLNSKETCWTWTKNWTKPSRTSTAGRRTCCGPNNTARIWTARSKIWSNEAKQNQVLQSQGQPNKWTQPWHLPDAIRKTNTNEKISRPRQNNKRLQQNRDFSVSVHFMSWRFCSTNQSFY